MEANDLVWTRLCALAMGLDFEADSEGVRFSTKWGTFPYDPIRDDAQAMALVKKFRIVCKWAHDDDWVAYIGEASGTGDLNRAIVKCVALTAMIGQ